MTPHADRTEAAEPDKAPLAGWDAAEGLSAAGTWLELSVEADHEAVEAVSEILARVAPGGVSIEPRFTTGQEGLTAQIDPTRPQTVRAFVSATDTSAARSAVREVSTALGHLQAFGLRPIGDLRTAVVREEDWADAWKRHFPVLRIGRRVVIRPTWRRYRRAPDDVVVALDPGMAFGTGLHPTTRLCLETIEAWADAGLVREATMLDVGCGSGILALAAARFGARRVLGVDPDPLAVEATTANARRNRLTRVVRARRGSLPVPEAPFDLVCANLVASLLVTMAAGLAASLRPPPDRSRGGGRLVAGGIFVDREPEVRRAFAAASLRTLGRRQEGDWVALDLERPG